MVLWLPAAAQSCVWPPSPIRPANADSSYGLVEIPVVVHVVWHEAAENITDEQIWSQLAVLNADYRGLNADQAGVTQPLFRQTMADMEMSFSLAQTDPQGQPSTGIIRRQTSLTEVGLAYAPDGRRRVCYNELGGSDAWPSDCYLNIWIADLPTGLAGQATLPGQANAAEDGVFIRPDRFGTLGTVTAPYHLGRTATHEIGHFFNLLHPWGSAANATCADDDGVSDTPCQSQTYAGACPMGTGFTCGTPDMTQNFMGLSQDPCVLFFTHGQKARVRAALASQRSGFLPSANCTVSLPESPDAQPWLGRCYLDSQGLWLDIQTEGAWWAVLYDLHGRPWGQWQGRGPSQGYQSIPNLLPGIYALMVRNGTTQIVKKLMFAHP